MTALAHCNSGWQDVLTPRQAEYLELVAAGLTNREIALEYRVTKHAVKSILAEIYLKLGIYDFGGRERLHDGCARVKAARWWWENVESRSTV